MDRSRSFSRPSSAHRNPTPSPPTTKGRNPPRGRPMSSHETSRPLARSKSRAKTPSRPSSRASSSSPARRQQKHGKSGKANSQDHHHGLFKTSAGLIAGIGLATVLAHKVWPKGILYGGAEEWESRPIPKHHHSDRHEHRRHHHRHSSDTGRVVERARRRGDVVYYEEISHFPSRRRSFGPQTYERMSRGVEENGIPRPVRDDFGPPPHPDAPYPGEVFYEPERRRPIMNQQAPMPR
ncbi:hypothetical protein FZEAL_2732 [Fusarium zealandicum]|uniref:Uncharacterized protein n=1 Tax=Fusarium zealandicum TaxID=1053134 RepID=A0A8H4UQZ8_9HYPO|nr:hypothetical protein FZEAL_2732 [Fusarium zealandicum]